MKAVILLAIVACAFAATLTEADYQMQFSIFERQFQRNYATPAERSHRYNIFKSNLDFIVAHNEDFKSGKTSFTVAPNMFADMTNDEYRRQVLSGVKAKPSHSQGLSFVSNVVAPPASWDWRQNGYTIGVKNQGQCGSCWSFSATAALEHAHQIATDKKDLVALSEQLCVDCANGGKDTCSVGGEMQDCYKYVIEAGGDETEKDYPYTAKSAGKCYHDSGKKMYKFTGYVNVTSESEEELLLAAAEHVVSVAIDASSMAFQFYSSGVFDHSGCKTKMEELDHGVAVVGWGTQSGKDFWTVRNSWGSSWGQAGHILMSRNKKNQCGIATDASYPIGAAN